MKIFMKRSIHIPADVRSAVMKFCNETDADHTKNGERFGTN